MRRRSSRHASIRPWLRRVVSVVLAALLMVSLVALPGERAMAEEALSPEALEIANQLNCPVCQGQSVRDSNSELARQMRQLIQQKLDQGESREQILQYFVDRYGVGILREPPREGFLWLLWWGPVIGLSVGIVLVALYLRRRGTSADTTIEEVSPETLAQVEQWLGAEGEAR